MGAGIAAGVALRLPLWLPELSRMTISPGLRVGARHCSTHAVKAIPLIGQSSRATRSASTKPGAGSSQSADVLMGMLRRSACAAVQDVPSPLGSVPASCRSRPRSSPAVCRGSASNGAASHEPIHHEKIRGPRHSLPTAKPNTSPMPNGSDCCLKGNGAPATIGSLRHASGSPNCATRQRKMSIIAANAALIVLSS